MSDSQVPLAILRRSHHLSDHRHVLDEIGNPGSRHCPSFTEIRKFVGRERSSSVLLFNWKEENLLKKKLSFLESMKKYEANAWLREQKAFYKRYQTRLQTLELEHARLLGNKDLVRQLTSQNKLSNSTSTVVDQSETAVKAILQARAGRQGRSPPALTEGPLDPAQAQAAARGTSKADLKKERWMRAVTLRGSPSRGQAKPSLALCLDAPRAPVPGAQPRSLLVDSRPMSSVQSSLPDADGGRKLKDKFLQYIVGGDRHVDREIRPGARDSPNGPSVRQVAEALLTRRRDMPGWELPMHKGARCPQDSTQSAPWAPRFLRTTLPTAPWGTVARECYMGQGPEYTVPEGGNVVIEEAGRHM